MTAPVLASYPRYALNLGVSTAVAMPADTKVILSFLNSWSYVTPAASPHSYGGVNFTKIQESAPPPGGQTVRDYCNLWRIPEASMGAISGTTYAVTSSTGWRADATIMFITHPDVVPTVVASGNGKHNESTVLNIDPSGQDCVFIWQMAPGGYQTWSGISCSNGRTPVAVKQFSDRTTVADDATVTAVIHAVDILASDGPVTVTVNTSGRSGGWDWLLVGASLPSLGKRSQAVVIS